MTMLHVYEFEVFESEGWAALLPLRPGGRHPREDDARGCGDGGGLAPREMEHYEMAGMQPPEPTFGNKPEHGGENMIVA